jgi:lipid II:glycine glycyltransferase (peptidoglycan interpeptide bridge formation enzyme)
MELITATEKDRELWDGIVKSSPHGTLFHTWKWLKIMEKHNFIKLISGNYRGQLYPIIVRSGDEIIGLIPIFVYKTPFIKMACSPPFSVENAYLGPILNNYQALRSHNRQVLFYEFHKVVDNYLKHEVGVNYISIHSSPNVSDPRPYVWTDYQVFPQFTYFIELKGGEKNVWDGFSRTLRQDINKVKKRGIRVEIGSKQDVEYIFDLLIKRDHIHANKEFLLEIFDNFAPKNLIVFIVKHENELLGGVITICYKNKVGLWVGMPRISYEGTTPNTLIFWEAINWAIENGFEIFEIIGASELSYFIFKSKFNGELVPYHIMKWYSPLWKFGKTVQQLLKGNPNK